MDDHEVHQEPDTVKKRRMVALFSLTTSVQHRAPEGCIGSTRPRHLRQYRYNFIYLRLKREMSFSEEAWHGGHQSVEKPPTHACGFSSMAAHDLP
jgi:hypothetical protein